MVVNGDVLTDCDVGALVDFHRKQGAEATIFLTPVEDPSVFGVVPTDAEGRVEAFIEKPTRDDAPTNLVNAGIYVVEPSVLGRIAREGRVSIERETFPAMVADRSLYALALDAYWIDAGTPDAYLRAHRDLLSGRRPGLPAPGAELDPSLGPGVWRIGEPAGTEGTVSRSLLGAGASIGPNATVEDSVVGAGAVVEEGASVAGAVLLPAARIASKATVEGSIIGPGAIVGQRCTVHALSVVGAGAVTASGTVVDGERVPAGV